MAERSKALQLSCRGLADVGSNLAGDIYFHFEFFAPSPFRTGQRSRCKWNQACPFTRSHSCFRPQIWFIIQGLVYKYLQYSFNIKRDFNTNFGLWPITRYAGAWSTCSLYDLYSVTPSMLNILEHDAPQIVSVSIMSFWWRLIHRSRFPIAITVLLP